MEGNKDQGLYQRITGQRPTPDKRVIRAADRVWDNNIQTLIDYQNGFEDKAIACFLRKIPAGGQSDIHRHNFEAMGYVVKGRGYEIHDGERIDWSEGDAVFIPANVWHQHVNADPDNEAIVLLITNWPLLLHLGITTLEPAPTWEDALSRPSALPHPNPGAGQERAPVPTPGTR
jgi:gentisate 1,2-dioxygenase